jgi:ABC-2 type transport system ATP-binding protein
MSELAIHAHALVRDFKTVRALDHLSLEVPAGIVFGFLGPNGAGKTTAIRTFLGLVEPNEGSARVLGFDIRTDGARIRAKSGALLEHNGLYERLTAEQNLDFYARAWHMSAGDRRVRTRELLMQFGLWDRRTDVVEKWSRGMKQKLAVARTVLHRPPLVFLDEPTAGLDPVASAALREDLAELARAQGVTIFLTTHNLSEAERLCSRIGVIRGGRLVALGTPGELRERMHAPRVRIVGRGLSDDLVGALGGHAHVERVERQGDDIEVTLRDGASAAPLVAMLVSAGAELEEVRRERATLEETFLELVTSDGAPREVAPS